jgi:hypothetical protein
LKLRQQGRDNVVVSSSRRTRTNSFFYFFRFVHLFNSTIRASELNLMQRSDIVVVSSIRRKRTFHNEEDSKSTS